MKLHGNYMFKENTNDRRRPSDQSFFQQRIERIKRILPLDPLELLRITLILRISQIDRRLAPKNLLSSQTP